MQLTHTIQDTGKELCFVGLPEDVKYCEIELGNLMATLGYFNVKHICKLPQGDWQLLGTLDQIKEEDLEGVFPSGLEETNLECLKQLMGALRLYTVNPYGEKEPQKEGAFILPSDYEQWHEAQSRTFKQWAILKREINGTNC